jgi:diaminopimelate epimerase
MLLHFFKYQGTGNDFVIIDNREGFIQLSDKQVALLCDRHFGIGADGLMLLNKHDHYDFEMIYFNADGAPGTMCGNGGRCLTKFAYDQGMQLGTYKFIASDGEHVAVIDANGWIHLKMIDVQEVKFANEATVLNTGSPHYIKQVLGLSSYDVFTEGKNIRYNDSYNEKGINVNFVEWNDNELFVRTYERGVENETFSCGTGVTAAAIAMSANNLGNHETKIRTLGGSLLIKFNKIDAQHYNNVWLCGPALFVYEGQITI